MTQQHIQDDFKDYEAEDLLLAQVIGPQNFI